MDAKMVAERKLEEALERENKLGLQMVELKRKLASVESRVRVVNRKKDGKLDGLDARILVAVRNVVQDRALSDEVKDKVAEAVALAVAHTLLAEGTSAAVAPPKRLPPPATEKAVLVVSKSADS
jgi:hypothetical protein